MKNNSTGTTRHRITPYKNTGISFNETREPRLGAGIPPRKAGLNWGSARNFAGPR